MTFKASRNNSVAGRVRRLVAVIAAAGLVGGGAAAAVLASASAAGAVPSCDVTVDAGAVHSPITTIQGGIDAASANDTICVYPGLYNQDAALNRDPDTGGVGSNDFNIFVGTPGVTIEGLDSGGNLITAAPEGASSANAPVVEAAAQEPDFGTSNIFVQADNVTVRGLEINGDPNDIAKSVELVGNGDTVTDDAFAPSTDAGGTGIYISDYHFDPSGGGTSTVTNYSFTDNTFDGDQGESAIYVASGAGWTGPASGRVISGNTFNNMDDAMDFAGPTPEIGWLLYPVGTATITGNTFSNSGRRQLLVWGTGGPGVGYAAPDWCGIMAGNTFDRAAFTWAGTAECPSGAPRTWSADDSPNGNFTDIAGLYSTIQRYAINKSQAGDTVQLLPGTYDEQLVVGNTLTIQGAGQATTTIEGPSSMTDSACMASTRVVIDICGSSGSTVTMTGVTISGGANGEAADANTCGGPSIRGAQISDGETLNISQSTVTNTYSSSGSGFWGCQTNAALGIRAGSQALNEVGHLIADHLTVERYTKGGIVVDGPGSSTTITHSLVEGDQLAGASAVSSRNGIQISRGASGTVSSTTVSGNECDIASPTCGPDLVNNDQAAGILLYDPTTGQTPVPTITLSGNIVTGNDDGIYTAQMTGTPMISANTVNANRHEGVQLDEGTATLMGNQITGNGSGSGDGVFASEGDYGLADTTATLSGNTITGNASGVVVADLAADAFTTHLTAQRNSLASNPTVGLNNEAASSVTATCNWWGQSTGPASGEVMGTATTTPFLGSSNLAGACPAHTAPSAPRPTSAVPYNDHSAKVIWQVPVSTGGTPITGYVITPYLAGVAQPAHVFNSTATSEFVTGLTDMKSYQFTVAAKNAVGTGPQSVKTAPMIAGAPGQPGVPTVQVVSGALKVTFAAPLNDGAAISKFTVSCTSSNGGATKSATGPNSPITVTGVTVPKSYTCTVTATNSRGTGPKSKPSAPVNA